MIFFARLDCDMEKTEFSFSLPKNSKVATFLRNLSAEDRVILIVEAVSDFMHSQDISVSCREKVSNVLESSPEKISSPADLLKNLQSGSEKLEGSQKTRESREEVETWIFNHNHAHETTSPETAEKKIEKLTPSAPSKKSRGISSWD